MKREATLKEMSKRSPEDQQALTASLSPPCGVPVARASPLFERTLFDPSFKERFGGALEWEAKVSHVSTNQV